MIINYNQYNEYLACPKCQGNLSFQNEIIYCLNNNCKTQYGYKEGIANLTLNYSRGIPIKDFENFYSSDNVISMMNLNLGNNAASRRVYLIEYTIRTFHPKVVLDLSVGSGIYTQIAFQNGVNTVFGFDIYSTQLVKLVNIYEDNFIPVIADARMLPVKNKMFDLVLNCNLIEHLDLWEDCLQKSIDASRKIFVLSTDTRSLSESLNFAKFGENLNGHLHVYNHYKLRDMLATNCNIVYELFYTFSIYHYLSSIYNIFLRKKTYGIGEGLRVPQLIPRYIHDKTKSWKHMLYSIYGNVMNYFMNKIEREQIWRKRVNQKDYQLASMYIAKKYYKISDY